MSRRENSRDTLRYFGFLKALIILFFITNAMNVVKSLVRLLATSAALQGLTSNGTALVSYRSLNNSSDGMVIHRHRQMRESLPISTHRSKRAKLKKQNNNENNKNLSARRSLRKSEIIQKSYLKHNNHFFDPKDRNLHPALVESQKKPLPKQPISQSEKATWSKPKNYSEDGEKNDIYYSQEQKFWFKLKQDGNPLKNKWQYPIKPDNNQYWKFVGAMGAGLEFCMSGVPDETRLDQLSIINAHDAATAHWGTSDPTGLIVTQDKDLMGILKIGVRCFDIRACVRDGKIQINHGPVYLKIDLEDVITIFIEYLKEHPLEFILMKIKQEHSKASYGDFVKALNKVISNDHKDYLFQEYYIPSAGEIRGKIVIVSDTELLRGIPWSEIGDKSNYKISASSYNENALTRKKEWIHDRMYESIEFHRKHPDIPKMYATALSATPGSAIYLFGQRKYGVEELAYKLNAHAANILSRVGQNTSYSPDTSLAWGVISANFINENLSSLVHKFNPNNVVSHSKPMVYDDAETGASITYKNFRIISTGNSNFYVYNAQHKELIGVTKIDGKETIVCLPTTGNISDSFLWKEAKEKGTIENGTVIFLKNKKHDTLFYPKSLDKNDLCRQFKIPVAIPTISRPILPEIATTSQAIIIGSGAVLMLIGINLAGIKYINLLLSKYQPAPPEWDLVGLK